MYTPGKGILSAREVAKLLGISVQTLYNWLNVGKIPEPNRHPATQRRQWRPEDVDAIRVLLAEARQ